MKKLSILIVAIALLSLVSMAQALPVPAWNALTAAQGQMKFDLASLTVVGNWIKNVDDFSVSGFYSNTLPDDGTLDFAGFPDVSVLNGVPTVLSFPSIAGWTLSSTPFGTWTTTSGEHTHGKTGNSDFVNIELEGYFEPGSYSGFTGNSWNYGSIALTITQQGSGNQINGSGTILLGNPVPEASTLVGFGSALAMAGPGLVGWLRRRRA